MKKILLLTGVFLLGLLSCGLFVYPFVSNYVYDQSASSIIETSERQINTIDEQKKEQLLDEARHYNEELSKDTVVLTDPFKIQSQGLPGDYFGTLKQSEDGYMGSIEIPSLNLNLPIYHGTGAEVLEKGIGHLQGSSLPVGGIGTHSVLTGHSGLANARFFTDLDRLVEGDVFVITVLGHKIAYKVVGSEVVEPSQTSSLNVVRGEDRCTLITCTPYGVNSHRLFVHGVRTEVPEKSQVQENHMAAKPSRWQLEYLIGLGVSMVLLVVFVVVCIIRRKK